jgi:hypothetical protein
LATAQKQLVAVEKSLELSSEAGSRYLVEMDMLKQLFHEVADVEVVWPDLDLLIAAFAVWLRVGSPAHGNAPARFASTLAKRSERSRAGGRAECPTESAI